MENSRRKFLQVASSAAGAAVLVPGVHSIRVAGAYPSVTQLRARHEKAGIISPLKTYRMMEWEFHTPPEEHFNTDLDAATRAARRANQLFRARVVVLLFLSGIHPVHAARE